MLKSLRKKFLFYTYLSIFIVVSLLVSIINFSNYSSNIQKHYTVIDNILNNSNNFDNNNIVLSRYIVVIDVVDDTPIIRNGFLSDEYDLNTICNSILSLNKENGRYDSFSYGYLKTNNNYTIVLSNMDRDNQLSISFFYNSLFISICGVLLVYFIIYLFSSYILKPFIKNEENQKEFITNVSHELKTPITIIKANLDVLKIDNIDNEWTQSINNQIDRLELLTSNLIDLSKLEEMNNNFIKTEFSLSDAINEVSSNYSILFNEKNILFTNYISNNISFNGNEKQIRDVIKLLFDNIIKYAINDASIEFENNLLIFSNSTDLSDGNYDYIFNRFYRIDESRNQSTKGYGIGLSIVKKILDNHNCILTANVINKVFYIKIKL